MSRSASPPSFGGSATAPAELLHLDHRIAVIAKPPGLSLATPQRAPEQAVERLIGALPAFDRDLVLGLGMPSLVHRLDVGTSGVVLLARDAETHRELVAAFSARRVEKTYLALVWGHPRPRHGCHDQPLGPDRKDRRRMLVDPGGRGARTRYAALATPRHVCLLALRPETGRTHQIRVHLSHAGHPVVGDDLYGGARHRGLRDSALRTALAPSHTLLHALALTLPPPFPQLPSAALPLAFRAALTACGIDGGLVAAEPIERVLRSGPA